MLELVFLCDEFVGFLYLAYDDFCLFEEVAHLFLGLVEVVLVAEEVVFCSFYVVENNAENLQVVCLLFGGLLNFGAEFGELAFFLGDDVLVVFSYDWRRERSENFELSLWLCEECSLRRACHGVPESYGLDGRVYGNGAVRCPVVIAAHAFFFGVPLVERMDVAVRFDKAQRNVKRSRFACDVDAVEYAFLAVEFLRFVERVACEKDVLHAHEQAVGVVGVGDNFGNVLEEALRDDFLVTLDDGCVRRGAAPDFCAEEERVGDSRFLSPVEKCGGLDDVREGHPFANGNVDVVRFADFRDFADDGKRVFG